MMNMKILGAVAALALLAGCTSNIDHVSMAHGTGSPFTQALTSEYQAYVAEEKSEYDWGNALTEEGNFLAAANHYERAVRLKPKSAKELLMSRDTFNPSTRDATPALSMYLTRSRLTMTRGVFLSFMRSRRTLRTWGEL